MPLKIQKWFPDRNEGKLLRHLEDLYRDTKHDVYLIHNYLLATKDGVRFRPDFIIIDPHRGIAIVEEKSYIEKNLHSFNLDSVIFRNGDSDWNPIRKGEDYAHNLRDVLGTISGAAQRVSIRCHLVFTNLPHNFVEFQSSVVNKHYKDYRSTLSLDSLFDGEPIDNSLFLKVASRLCPITTFNKEAMDLHRTQIDELDKKQVGAVTQSPFGHFLVSGIPGSGKSVVLVSRALFLLDLYPDWKILILSVNDKLKEKNEAQIDQRGSTLEKFKGNGGIFCKNLMSFLRENCRTKYFGQGYDNDLKNLVQEISNSEVIPSWDAVLIDEYQDFSDDVLKLLLRFARKMEMEIGGNQVVRENLFLVGDKLQQIWENGCSESWNSIGIHILGRTKNLKSSYRCGQTYLQIALEVLKSSNSKLRKQVEQFYEGDSDISYEVKDDLPIRFSSNTWFHARSDISRWISHLRTQGVRFDEIMIIVPDYKPTLNELSNEFSEEIRQGLIIGMPSTIKGLESRFCAIYNIDFIKNPKYNSPEIILKTIYMCLTRASMGLFVNSFNQNDPIYQKIQLLSHLETDEEVAG